MLFMSSDMTYEISTSDSAGTQKLAERLASLLTGGEVIELASDLGGGKTTFVQGLARGLGYSGNVTSPTFTLSQIYPLPTGLELHHYDLYRLAQSGVVGNELAEDIGTAGIITIIEWAGVAENDLPKDRMRIELEVTGDTTRRIIFSTGGSVSRHLIEALQSQPGDPK
jgi:tRNA threonylcarbamoyladenosine biosynthesis protein TsaE